MYYSGFCFFFFFFFFDNVLIPSLGMAAAQREPGSPVVEGVYEFIASRATSELHDECRV